MQKPGRLKITNRFGITRYLPLDKPIITIGRKAENDLQILSDSVSRRHAEVVFNDEIYFLVDVGSKRGTFINNQRVDRWALQHMDVIRIGGADDQQIIFLDDTIERASAIFDSSPHLTLSIPSQSRELIPSANEELQKLARFIEVNQAFKFSLTPDDVLCLIVDASIEITNAERGFLMLRNDNGDLEFKVARDRDRNTLAGNDFVMSRSVVEESFKLNRSVIINDASEGTSRYARHNMQNIDLRSIACIPLRRFQMNEHMDATSIVKRDVIGVLYVDSSVTGTPLTETSIRLLESLAFEATKSLENVRLMQEEQEKKNLEFELGTAREVQLALSPISISQTDKFAISPGSLPSRFVGGDFFDIIPLPDNRFAFALGDVSGKGIAAAILAGVAQGALQGLFTSGTELETVFSIINKVVTQRSASNSFVTLFCGVLDTDGTFSFINAGHNPPVLARCDGSVEHLFTKSLIIGAFDFAQYKSQKVTLKQGDTIAMFTDGVTEAVNKQNEMFGDSRLEQLIIQNSHLSAELLKERIINEVHTFTEGQPQMDDITLLVLKMK